VGKEIFWWKIGCSSKSQATCSVMQTVLCNINEVQTPKFEKKYFYKVWVNYWLKKLLPTPTINISL